MPYDFSAVDLDLEEDDQEKNAVQSNFSEAVKLNADQHAEQLRLAKDANVPAFAVDETTKQKFDFNAVDFDGLVKDNPKTTKFLGNFDNAVVAQDDVDVLQSIENMFDFSKTFENIGETSKLGFEAQFKGAQLEGVDRTPERVQDLIPFDMMPPGVMSPQEAQIMSADFAKTFGIETDEELVRAKEESVNRLITEIRTLQEKTAKLTPDDLNLLEQGVRGGVDSLINMAPGFGLMLLSGGRAAPMLATMGAQTYAASYGDARAEGLDTAKATWFAGIQAAIEVGTEMLPTGTLERILTGKSTGMKKEALKFLVQEMGTEQLATLGQSINEYAFGLDEQMKNATSLEEMVAIQAQRQAVTAIATVVAGGAQAAAVTGIRKGVESLTRDASVKQTKGDVEQQKLDTLNTESEKSKLRERDKESFRQFVQEADGDNNTHVFIDGAQASLYLQSKTSEEIAADPVLKTLSEQVSEASQLGGDIQIPVADFAADFAGTEHFDALRQTMTMSEETVAPFRQEQVQQEQKAYITKLMEEANKNTTEYVQAQEIFTQVRDQLIDTGAVTPANASIMAQIVPAWATAQATRTGKTVEQVYQDAGLTVEGPQTGERARQADEMVLSQAKESGFTGDSVVEATEYQQAVDKGLDMSDEARTQRAQEMGFDTDTILYHGTSAEFDAFATPEGVAGHFTTDENVAKEYGDKVIASYIRVKNPVTIMDEDWRMLRDKPELLQSLKRKGHDAAVSDDTGDVIVFSPENIRSTEAAFDPAFTESAILLAQGKTTPAQQAEVQVGEGLTGAEFNESIKSAAESNVHAPSVSVYDSSEYDKYSIFTFDEGRAGFAIQPDGLLISVFKHPDSKIKGALDLIVPEAIERGATHLEAFDGFLTESYSKYGFVEVDRIPWDENYRPKGWDDSMGKPDVVIMELDYEKYEDYTSKTGAREIQDLRGIQRSVDSLQLGDEAPVERTTTGREPDGSLNGLPREAGRFTASVNKEIGKVASDYMESIGVPYNPPEAFIPVDPQFAERVADAYEQMEHNPNDPEVKAAYEALASEVAAQYQAALDAGLKVEFIDFQKDGDPYAESPRMVTDDINNNNHMWVFSTRDGFGSDDTFDPSENPLLAETEFEISGQKALVNDLFRVVHDYFGHAKEGVGFRANGEDNAFRAHSAMFSPLAQRALTTETRGQNSWLNYGPYGEQNRTAKTEDTIFADQKTGLLPEWVSNVSDDMVLQQSMTLRKGTETLKRFGLDPDKTHTTRAVAAALEARQRQKYGKIGRNDKSPEASRKIADWMVQEVLFEMENPENSGVGWYSDKFQRSIDVFAQEFPELKTDKNARDTFTVLVALTSDGQKVLGNFKMAADIYSNFRDTGKFTTDLGTQRQGSVNINLKVVQELHDEMGPGAMHEYLMEEMTIGELKKLARAQGVTFQSSYKVDVTMPRAALLLGPKLGAFYANLMGSHGYLTMDRWWSRTFNRYRGTLLTKVVGTEDKPIDSKGRKIGLAKFKEMIGEPDISDDEALSRTIAPWKAYKDRGYKNGTPIEKFANTIHKAAFDEIQDVPYNASDRSFMLDTVEKAANSLKRKGHDISIADIQAILWYYEKKLYGGLGTRQPEGISYEEAAQQTVSDRTGGPLAQSTLEQDIEIGEEIFNPEIQQGEVKGQARGYYEPANSIIRLTEAADLSTFLHEFAHFMYEMEVNGNTDMLQSINAWYKRNANDVAKEANSYLGEKFDTLKQTIPGVFHGTKEQFPLEEIKANAPLLPGGGKDLKGIYFTTESQKAYSYARRGLTVKEVRALRDQGKGPRVIAADITISNPLDITDDINNRAKGVSFAEAKQQALSKLTPEHDGVIFRGDDMNSAEYIVFDASQIKPSEQFKQEQDIPTAAEGSITPQDVVTFLDNKTTGDKMKDAAIRRAVHEQFARGFETYLMEGKAPSIELRNAFRTFARWLARIYESMRSRLNVNLDDEMRAVFDRLVATEDQIAAAEARAQVEPMFTDAAMAGMTEAEFVKYKERQEKVKDVQSETLRNKLIKQLTRQTEKWWKEEKSDIVDEELDSLKKERVYAAREHLKSGDLKLDHATVKEMAGEEKTNKLGKTSVVVPPALIGMTAKGQQGVHPDEAAAFLGYNSGSEMIADLIAAPAIKVQAETNAEAKMIERHGDIFTDGTIEREADEAVQNEERGKLILAELKALAKGTNAPTIDRATIKEVATTNIGKLSFREIHPAKYRRAEIRAAQDAARALADGNKELAAEAKMRQVMNYYLGMEALKAKNETTKIVDRTARYNKKKVREEIMKAENGYMGQIDKILGRFEFRKAATLKQVESINLWVKERTETDGDGLVISNVVLDESYVTHWKNIPFSDLQGINDSVKNIEHVARYANKIRMQQEEIDFNKLKSQWVDNINEQDQRFPTKESRSRIDDARRATTMDHIRKWASQLTKVPYLASWLDGGERAGMSHDVLVQPFTDALDAKMKMVEEVALPVIEAIRNRSKADQKRHNTKIWIPEIEDHLMGHQIIAVALNAGNQGNLKKMLLGEGWADPEVDTDIDINNPKLQAVLKHMTKSDWVLVQSIWDQMNVLYPQLAEVHRRTTGLTPPKVEATPIVTEFGTFRGGYYPVKYSPKRSHKAEKNAEKREAETESMFNNTASIQASVNAGATNERTGFYDRINLSLEVVPDHFNETIHYITHHDAVRQVNRLIQQPDVANAITGVLGEEEFKQLKPWLNDIAKDGRQQPVKTYIDSIFQRLRFGTTLGIMGFKASTGIMQVYGLLTTAAELGVGPTVKGIYTTVGRSWYMKSVRKVLGSTDSMQSGWEFAAEKSKVMNHRVQTMDREIKNAMNLIQGKRGIMAAVQEASMKHIALIQTYMVDLPTWHAAYAKELSESGDERKAVNYADWAVENLQGSGATKDMATILRNQSKLLTTMTMFMTFFSSLGNLSRDLVKGSRSGLYSNTTVAAKMMFLFTLPVFFEMLMRGEFDEPEDEDDRLNKFLLQTALYPLTSIPFVRDAAGGLLGDYGYNSSPVASVIEKGIQGYKQIGERAFTDEEITLSAKKNASKLTGVMLGVPGVAQAWASGEHLYDVLEEGEEFTARELLFGPNRE